MMNNRRYSPVPPSQSVSINNNHCTTHRVLTLISVASLLITALVAAVKITYMYHVQVVDDGNSSTTTLSSSFDNNKLNYDKDYYDSNTNTKISIPLENKNENNFRHTFTPLTTIEKGIIPTKVAFIGNSILYFNDSPRFLSKLVSVSSTPETYLQQDSCLRGGASLVSILSSGNGMEEKFHTPNAKRNDGSYDIGSPTIQSLFSQDNDDNHDWDYVIMNDYTQQPARFPTRLDTIKALNDTYVPYFYQNTKLIIPILLMTHAYRKPTKNSNDLFPVSNFTKLLCQGYQQYATVIDESLKSKLPPNHEYKNEDGSIARIAYVGKAYEILYNENNSLWEKLFYIDDLHPSTYGTVLQGFVLYCTIYYSNKDEMCNPPVFEYESDIRGLWIDARRMYPPEDNVVVHYPNVEEVGMLRDVAIRVWKMSMGDWDAIC